MIKKASTPAPPKMSVEKKKSNKTSEEEGNGGNSGSATFAGKKPVDKRKTKVLNVCFIIRHLYEFF